MNENRTIQIENHYFPSVYLFKTSIDETYIKIFACERYKKMSFKNRCVVVGANGMISLTVPIENGRDQKLPFKEVKIADSNNWQHVHWETIRSCYGKSPFWEFYADYFAPFFEKKYNFLWDLNSEVLRILWRIIDKKKELSIENELVEEIKLFGSDFMPKNYLTFTNTVSYPQLFEDRIGFHPNVSILDLICMEGPNAVNVLKSAVNRPI